MMEKEEPNYTTVAGERGDGEKLVPEGRKYNDHIDGYLVHALRSDQSQTFVHFHQHFHHVCTSDRHFNK
jgi:hypothetical protein